jgi:hopanoid-associated phosphorylase
MRWLRLPEYELLEPVAEIAQKMAWTAVVVGMKLEALIARQPGIRVVCGATGPVLAGLFALASTPDDCCGLMSFGVAGGLAPNLRPGTWIVGSEILCGEFRIATHERWSKDILARIPGAVCGAIAGVSAPIGQPSAKAALHMETGAVAVDMESHIVANIAAAHRLPMVAVRVIVDPAEHALPRAAVASLCSSGAVDMATLMRLAMEYPAELPGLLKTALYGLLAGAALVRGRRILQSHIGPTDSGEATRSAENCTEQFPRNEYSCAERWLAPG